MAPETVLAEQTYRALKDAIMHGRFAPGAPLNTHAVAAEHEISVSPVRDAFHRLVGERLLESRSSGGFQIPFATAESVRALYLWHHSLLRMAFGSMAKANLHQGGEEPSRFSQPVDAAGIAAAASELFAGLGARSGDSELAFAIRAAGDRLHTLRICEGLYKDRVDELQKLRAVLVSGAFPGARRALGTYLRWRLHHVDAILACLYDPRNWRRS
ncbi:MAG: hypothetical protein ABT11_04515 [Novosphingobium sp. SCN 66-18]|nr:MAG: hypothetical protein ABT11_04515 [Novosphingobium sp. SCN 66-18]